MQNTILLQVNNVFFAKFNFVHVKGSFKVQYILCNNIFESSVQSKITNYAKMLMQV